MDLDFFTEKEFPTDIVLKQLEQLSGFKLDETTKWTILGSFPKVKFSYFYYRYPLINKPSFFSRISIASLEDIAAMKVEAIGSRGTKRDFIDLYFLTRKFSLDKILKFYDKKYHILSSNIRHILSSLKYFADAEDQEMPKMLTPISWNKVKDFFQKEVIRLAKKKWNI